MSTKIKINRYTSDGWEELSVQSEWSNIANKPTNFPPSSHTHNYLPLSGGTLTGNLEGQYLTGTWLRTTANTHLSSTASNFAVIQDGWIYSRTASEMVSDIGAVDLTSAQSITGTKTFAQINSPSDSSSRIITTGTNASSYFQSRRFRGEGTATSYTHSVDFGYSGHDSVDFYEYGKKWRFWVGKTWKTEPYPDGDESSYMCFGIEEDAVKHKGNTFTWPTKNGTFALTSDVGVKETTLWTGMQGLEMGMPWASLTLTQAIEDYSFISFQFEINGKVRSFILPRSDIGDTASTYSNGSKIICGPDEEYGFDCYINGSTDLRVKSYAGDFGLYNIKGFK